jgi:hypothetical protein
MLLAGLTGKAFADINDDGQITLGEVAEGVKQDMAFAEEQGAAFVAKGDLGLNTVLAEAKPRSSPDVSRRVEVKSEGDWYKARIIDARAGDLRSIIMAGTTRTTSGSCRVKSASPKARPTGSAQWWK